MTIFQHIDFWWSVITAFWINFTNTSVGKVSDNLPMCYGNATVVFEDGYGVYEEYINFEFEDAGYSTYNILKAIDPVIFACYSSIFDYYTTV